MMKQEPVPTNPHHWMDHVDNLLADHQSSELHEEDDSENEEFDDDDDSSFIDETEFDLSEANISSSDLVSEVPPATKEETRIAAANEAKSASPTTTKEQQVVPSTGPKLIQTTLRVPVAAKRPGEGIYISNAMRQFLGRTSSDSNIASKSNAAIYNMIYRSESAEKLGSNDQSRMVFVHQEKPKPSTLESNTAQRPKDLLKEILRANGYSAEPRSYTTLKDSYFLQVTPDMIAGYDMALMTAVRNNDLDTIKELYQGGRNLQCCNRFHESILHAAARRGCTPVMDFLLYTAKLNLKVVCDSGRTPLHDACWTGRPNFEVIRWMLETCPDFLLVADNRNFVPLDYVPKEAYPEWCKFLTEHQNLLKPQVVGSVTGGSMEE